MSNNKCDRNAYLFLSAHLRAREGKMLNRDKAERMLDAASFEEAAKMLVECGYEDMSSMSAKEVEKALSDHRAAVFADLAHMSPNKELIDVFRIKYDYHNAKTIMKSEAVELERGDLLSTSGRIDPEDLVEDFNEDNFRGLSETFAKAIAEARTVLNRTGNPQYADFILDSAYFVEVKKLAEELGSEFLKGYAEILVDSANLRTAVRTLRMNKNGDFLRTALVPGGSVDAERIVSAAGSGESLAQLFAVTKLKDAAFAGAEAVDGGRMTAFELACDNAVNAYLKQAKLVSFGEAPVIAFIAAVENEITAARMILTGRLAGIAPDTIRERLRDFYA